MTASRKPLDRNTILTTVAQMGRLPVLPRAVMEIEKELARPNASAHKIAELVQLEPGVCAAVLRVANSALHAPRREIVNVMQAITQLGLNEVRKIVLVASLIRNCQSYSKMDLRRFWLHSVAVGLTAVEISRTARVPVEAELMDAAFAAGLLHDIGALVLHATFPEHAAAAQHDAEMQGRSLVEVEHERWSVDHGEVGAVLADHWNLPPLLHRAMVFHHRPWSADPDAHALVQIVHIADFFANNQGFGRSERITPTWFDDSSWYSLGMTFADVTPIVDHVADHCEHSQVWVESIGSLGH
ncbi:MAG: HDOD domain-containing protein [Myxococcales bacterium]